MPLELVLSITDGFVTFGGKPLFEGLDFTIHEGDRIALVGKNGAGKTTLMQSITGERELDGGKRWEMPGISIGYLQQDVTPQSGQSVYDYVASGLGEDKDIELYGYMIDMVMEPFELDSNALMTQLSGGQVRRAALAKSLVEDPDVLLLDEPTNHLDLAGIEWLEEYLANYRGTLLCVSHDKAFLSNITNKIFWLDRGRIRVAPRGFRFFDEWSEELLEQERRELENRKKIVAQEVEWASKGVKARRKRNVRRLEQMKEARERLKTDQSAYRKIVRKVELEPLKSDQASKVVAEFFNISKSFERDGQVKPILEKFNMRIMRGDRIGVLGKNGSGKTTFLKLLIKQLEPDSGKVKLSDAAEIAYFDQKRADLMLDESMRKNLCPNGGDYVNVMGKPRHVCGYLKDFLFDPKEADTPVKILSGGQKNRLMLAKTLANPGNFLILDEPTNDLDVDTLEMLEETLSKYDGTLFVVSHDRDFLDQTVTKILAFEGNGAVEGYIGGYSDYLAATRGIKPQSAEKKPEPKPKQKDEKIVQKAPQQLSYKYQRELERLPEEIAALEQEQQELQALLNQPDSYMRDPEAFDKASRRLGRVTEMLENKETRWLELEEMQE